MAFGFGFALTAIAKAVGFTPRSLFTSDEQGAWYDPSDLSTMYQDAAGTIPVTAVGQPVGLMLDKSKNGVGTNGAKRVNLLTMTEQFDNSAWAKYSSTISGNAAVDPLGRSAANKIIESNTNNTHYIHRGGFSVSSGQTYIFSCLAKAAERNKIFLGSYDGSVGWGVSFNLANGTISGNRIGSGQSLVSSSSIDSLGNGWYRCSIKFTTTNTGISNYWAQIGLINTNGDFSNPNYLGDGTSGVYIWGADLRLASEASTLPTYQRIDADWPSTFPGNHATQSTTTSRPTLQQDTSGKYYLSFDGVDDWLVTPSIDFTATDKMTVFAEVRKLTDTASGVFVELSADSPTAAGAFVLLSPSSSGANSYKFYSRGSISPDSSPGNGVFAAAPDTSTITCISNISGPEQTLRRNAGLVQSSTASQGTGNYGNYPLYIGRRNGTSLPFNGNLYGLIVRGAQSTAQQISDTETWVNGKTGAY